MDTTAAVAAITAVGGNVTDIGLAIIGVAALVLAARWVKAMFF